MFVPPMPHDAYIEAVANHLTTLGHDPRQLWTTTPDGEQLDGVIEFRSTANPDLWTGKVWLGWDQRAGWALCDDARTLFPLDLDTYAAPDTVAVRAAEKAPRKLDDKLFEADFWGVGVLVPDGNGGIRMLLEPAQWRAIRHTVAGWCFAEEVYRKVCETRSTADTAS